MSSSVKSNKSGGKKSNLSVPGGKSDRPSARFRDPKDAKSSLAWKVLTDVQTKEILETETVDQLQECILGQMSFPNYECDLKEGILLDYYVSAMWWAKEQTFSSEQTSAFFTVIQTALENIKDQQLSVSPNLIEFKKMLVGCGLDNMDAKGGLECFDTSQAKSLTEYMFTSLFQHYRLYEFVFSATQAEEIIGTDLELEVAPSADLPWPPPLEEALIGDIHNELIATPAASPVPDGDEASHADGDGAGDGAESSLSMSELTAADTQREADILAQLSPEEVKKIMQEVCDQVLVGLQTDIAQKLRDKENAFINRINKIHKVL